MLKVLDAEQLVMGDMLWWRLLIETGAGRLTYAFPAFTFEARSAEYGITDPDELLEMILLEAVDPGEEHASPFAQIVEAARAHKRAITAGLREQHPVTFGTHPEKGPMRKFLRARMRVDPDNVAAFSAQVAEQRQARMAADAQARRQARTFTAADVSEHQDTSGPLAIAREAQKVRERAARLAAAGEHPSQPATQG